MALWVDKFRPRTLDRLDYHHEMSSRLSSIASAGDLPHCLFYGPSGAGKKTRVMALLREMFGAGVEKLKLEHRTFRTPTKRSIEVTTVASNFHIEINPGDAGVYDRYVVQEVIKEIAQFGPLDRSSFKVVVLTEVDGLTHDAQAALRRTMEKYSSSCRLILVADSLSKVIDPVRSRCLCIRVAAPSIGEIVGVLQSVGKREGLTVPDGFARRIAEQSKRNLRKALLTLEACRVQRYPFTVDQEVESADWESFVAVTAGDIIAEQSPKRLLSVRAKIYELLVNCIPADVIIKALSAELMRRLDDDLKHNVAYWAAHYEHRLRTGSKDIFHLEAFIAKFMSLYKRWLTTNFGS